jgi:hypothetical protein
MGKDKALRFVLGRERSARPRSSKRQMAYRNGTFKDWTQWAQMAQHEYPVYAQLAAERPMITAYNMAISDAAHPPVIHEILRKDGRILVHASDEIMVADVKVTVHDAQGKLLEVGEAVRQGKDWWEYVPQAQVEGLRVSVSVWDLPGNTVRLELK